MGVYLEDTFWISLPYGVTLHTRQGYREYALVYAFFSSSFLLDVSFALGGWYYPYGTCILFNPENGGIALWRTKYE